MIKPKKVIAIGDVHGCYTKLKALLKKHTNSGAELIFLGDLIDRAPEPDGDKKVLKLITYMQQQPRRHGFTGVTVLRGNHEQLCIDSMDMDPDDLLDWHVNGADPDFVTWLHANPKYLKWMKQLPYYAVRGNYLFVHGGVRPNVPLCDQTAEDLMWIRKPFLTQNHGLPYTVVHGHTVQFSETPVYKQNRIAIDLGACFGGPLCSLPLVV